MTDYVVRQFLEDAGIVIAPEDFNLFMDFCRAYFRELVMIGAFLKDVPYSDLTTSGKYAVLKGAHKLWKTVDGGQKIGIIVDTEIEFSVVR